MVALGAIASSAHAGLQWDSARCATSHRHARADATAHLKTLAPLEVIISAETIMVSVKIKNNRARARRSNATLRFSREKASRERVE